MEVGRYTETPNKGGIIRNSRNWRWVFTSAALTAAAIALFIHRWRKEGFNWTDFTAAFLHLHWFWLLSAVLLALATYYGRAIRWAVLIRPLCPDTTARRLFPATAIGFTAVVLFGRAGEFVRPYLISLKERVPFSSQVASWFLERIYDVLAAALIFGFALAEIGHSGMSAGPHLQWLFKGGGSLVALVSLAALFILITLHMWADRVKDRLLEGLSFLPDRYYAQAQNLVAEFVQGAITTRDLSVLVRLLFFTTLEWVLIAGCYFCLFKAVPGMDCFQIRDILVFMGFVTFGSVVQIPGIGGGMQLVAIIVLTELFRVGLELASSIAIITWLVTFVVIVPIGLVFLFREGLNFQKLREMEAKTAG